MGLLDELLMAETKKRNLMMQGTSPRVDGQLTQMVARPSQTPLREQFPTVYGALGGLLGMEPDSMEGSILDPNTAAVRQGAGYGYPAGLALQALPMAAPAVSGAKVVGKFVAPKAGQLAENYMRNMGMMPGIVPVEGAGLLDDAAIFKDASVLMNPKNLKPLNKVEDVEKYKTIVNSMEESGYQGRPILAYMDKGKAKALTGSHRIFASRKAGINVPVVFVNPSVMKWEDKSGLFGTFKESINDQRVYNYLKAAGDDVAASLSKLED